jgi:hypothetical protein
MTFKMPTRSASWRSWDRSTFLMISSNGFVFFGAACFNLPLNATAGHEPDKMSCVSLLSVAIIRLSPLSFANLLVCRSRFGKTHLSNTWSHLAFVFSSNSLSIYVNGTLTAFKTLTTQLPTKFVFDKNRIGSDGYLNVDIDVLKIYDKASFNKIINHFFLIHKH